MRSKRIIAFVLLVVFAFSCLGVVSAAEEKTYYYKVNSNTLNLREKPTTSSKVLAKLEKGDILYTKETKTKKANGSQWLAVKVEGSEKKGYVAKEYLKAIEKPNLAAITGLKITKDSGALGPKYTEGEKDLRTYIKKDAKYLVFSPKARSDKASFSFKLDGEPVDLERSEKGYYSVPVKGHPRELKITSKVGDQKKSITLLLRYDNGKLANIEKINKFKDVKLKEKFSYDKYKYTANVKYEIFETSLSFTRMCAYTDCRVTNNGEEYERDNIPLFVGKNVIKLNTTSPFGEKKTYTFTVNRAKSKKNVKMSPLEKRLVETAFRLLPERHPFVLAYEEAHKVDIKSYVKTIKGVRVSGIPFEFGGSYNRVGFSSRWWTKTSVKQYPVGGLDCAKFIAWIYKQAGYNVPSASTTLFFSGKEGTSRKLPYGPTHKVITSLKDAKIGDVAYNSQSQLYSSGHGSHTVMFIGTAEQLGIADTIRKYYKGFPVNKYLTIDVGFADGSYYYRMMKKLGISGRSSMCGAGIQFFTSIKGSNGKNIYKSPYLSKKKSYTWKDKKTGNSFTVACNLERNRRTVQWKTGTKIKNVMNLSRPIRRND